MNKKFEYRVFNMSSVKNTGKTWLVLLNELGSDGWEILFQLTKSSYLMKKELTS